MNDCAIVIAGLRSVMSRCGQVIKKWTGSHPMRSRKERVRFAALMCFVASVAACGGGGSGGGQATNHAPVADAGAAQTSVKRAVVTLDGSASHDPDGNSLSYAWSQTAGTTVTLSDSKSAKPT